MNEIYLIFNRFWALTEEILFSAFPNTVRLDNTTSTTDSNCSRLWESHQAMNRNLIRGRRDGTSWHNTAKFRHSALEVNGALGWRRFSFLPGEVCPALRPAKAGSARRGDTAGDRAEVSRGHSNEDVNRGAGKRPNKRRNPQARPAKGRTNDGEPTCAPTRHSKRRPAL